MMKKVIVISLGGSLVIPSEINRAFLRRFKRTILKNLKSHKFVIVTGGGNRARRYMALAKKGGKSRKEIAMRGIKATRENAETVMEVFGKISNNKLPKNKKEVKELLERQKVVICGSLIYAENETSDGTAAKLARYLKTDFINITDTLGLYTSDPRRNKSAKLILNITWENFLAKAGRIKFLLGQHFVLDQNAAKIIKSGKIKTYIKRFKGTIIEG
jgi:uridylate kinase